MAHSTACYLPKFGSASVGPRRPVSMRTKTTPAQNSQLLSAWDQGDLSSLMKASWALVLHHYTGLEDICFGYHPVQATRSNDSSNRATVSLTIDEDESIHSVVEKVKGSGGSGSENRLSETINTNTDPHLFNTILMLRDCRISAQNSLEFPLQPVLAIALPDECRIRLHIKVLQDNVSIFLEAWNNDVSTEQLKSIADIFEQCLDEVLFSENTIISDLTAFSEKDLRRVCKWNSNAPESYERCIHEAINEQVKLRPDSEAVCAWDGSLTYLELDRLASRVACHLQMRGVGPEVRVALCFDKSKWNIVAMLAVLKAGGAFVPLDPTHPTSRLQSLVKAVEAKVVLCSVSRAEYLKMISESLTPLGDATLEELATPSETTEPKPGVNTSNAAYVLFTSGSTGEPKGTLLEHRAFYSGAMAHAPPFFINPGARFLQFAAHTFDASIIETLSVLIRGACICVPSEEARLNNIVKAINDMKVDLASLTPSFVEFLDPESVPGLKTLILAGEAMSPSHLATWSKITLINGYGPTETSVCAAINNKLTPESDCRDIGVPTGARAWIVNPNDHNRLVPVGCPGELVLEGPTLARGYINNPQKTDEVFIQAPKWAEIVDVKDLGQRFYKTGDLVRYNSDSGSLTYIGRKDTQVKYHGQRIELGEIESHLSTDPSIKHCLVLLPKSGFSASRLVTVLSLASQVDEQPEFGPVPLKLLQKSKSFITEARERLAARLPGYMVPNVWLSVEALPMLASGKLDRKAVANWVGAMETDPDLQTSDTSNHDEEAVLPANETENQLVSIWSRVLNIPRAQLSLDESFLSLGGDSIAAITCMGHCKKQGIGLTVDDVLRSKSIRELAARAKMINNPLVYEETVEESFDLSPIQKLHFLVRKEGEGYFNQGTFTRLSRSVNESDLIRAVETLITRHSMLRARFTEDGETGGITQRVTRDIAGSYHWRKHIVVNREEIEQAISESQSCINCFDGPVLAVDLFNVEGDTLLSMTAHHLVVDIVSWRIILEDLEDLLLNPQESASQNCSLPFQTWCRLQDEQIQTLDSQGQVPMKQVPTPDFAYWGMDNRTSTYGDVDCASFEIDEETTSLIMMQCHKALQTEPIDLFLAALLQSFGNTFRDRALPVIYNEGHGREVWDPTIDISRTVGWFTTLYPIIVQELLSDDPAEMVMRVKDIRRAVADNGRQYFASRLLTEKDSRNCHHHYPMEISFNYVGQHRDLQRKDGLFQLVHQMAGETGRGGGAADFGEDTPRFGLFEISAMVVQGKARFIFSFNRFMKHQQAIRDWVTNCQSSLKSVAEHLQSLAPRSTLSDFPMLSLTYENLDAMTTKKLPSIGVESLDLVEDIYPCSFMQQGILLSQSRDTSLYAVHDTLEVKGVGRSKPDIEQLAFAWQKVVSHHALLRTVFVENLTAQDPFSQVVLKAVDASPVYVKCMQDSDVLPTLESQSPMEYSNIRPSHRFTICQTAAGKLFIRLEISHVIMDGTSISIILRDLQLAYSGKLDEKPRPMFKNFIRYIQDIPQKPSIDYWCTYLKDVKPCHFPRLTDGEEIPNSLRAIRMNFESLQTLQKLCETSGTTLSNAFNAAWGLTLRSFTASDEVCFSYLASLRDMPVQEIEWMVGPVINLMACRVKDVGSFTPMDLLKHIQNDYIEGLPHRNTSLIDIQHALKLSDNKLFNSGVSYRKLPPGANKADGNSINFSEIGSIYDPAEFSVYVNVEMMENDAHIDLNYWTTALSAAQAESVASTFVKSLQNIIDHSNDLISSLDILSERNKDLLAAWNHGIPTAIDRCVHEVFDEMANERPDAPAISSSEGSFSYRQVSELSSCLASYLEMLGVGSGSLVPIDFGKSMWAIVSILAVMKAGGGCIPMEASHSPSGLNQLLVDNDVQVALASPSRAQSLEGMFPYVVPVGESLYKYLPATQEFQAQYSEPWDNAYVVYTAGSFSGPRNVVLDHSTILTRAQSFASSLGMGEDTKMISLDSYTCDIFLQEIFGVFMRGGCICIPPGNNPKHLVTSINQLQANLLSMTPSIASSIRSSDVPNIQAVALHGEPMTNRARDAWESKTRLHTFYGASECGSICIYNPKPSRHDAQKMGSSVGCISWLVDISNHDLLAPIGCVGEVLIEGPILARGYLGDVESIEKNFIENPAWISKFASQTDCDDADSGSFTTATRRFFKTGDLARYNSDGALVYMGRKDKNTHSLVIDTCQVENCIDTFLPSENHSAVECISCGEDDAQCLAAFVVFDAGYSTKSDRHHIIEQMSLEFNDLSSRLHAHLLNSLPSTNVPTLYIPISTMPLTSLGRLDRQLLRNEAQSLTNATKVEFDVEKFNEFWRSTLVNSKSPQFPQVPSGASKVSATSQLERRVSIESTASDEAYRKAIVLSAWALVISSFTGSDDITFGEWLSTTTIPRRFQIESQSTIAGFLKNTCSDMDSAAPFCNASLQRIGNLSADAAHACKFNNVLGVLQPTDNVQPALQESKDFYNDASAYPLAVLCTLRQTEIQLSIQYDEKVLSKPKTERLMNQFVECLNKLNTVLDEQEIIGDMEIRRNSFAAKMGFWKEYLTDLEPCHFPSLLHGKKSAGFGSEKLILKNTAGLNAFCKRTDVDHSSLFQLAWALVLQCYTSSEEVCFGYCPLNSSGGPYDVLISRSVLNDEMKVEEILKQRKVELSSMLAHALPVAEVQHELGFDDTTLFDTILRYQAASQSSTEPIEETSYKIFVDVETSDKSIEIHFIFSTGSFGNDGIRHIVDCFEQTLDKIMQAGSTYPTIGDLDFSSSLTYQQLREWNGKMPDRIDRCVHQIIEEQVSNSPLAAPAICAWDANMTYAQLDTISTRLAHHLVALGVKPEIFVALCFEKSAWTIVAQLAVLKAGGAFAALDASHPETRLRDMVNDIGANVVLCSEKCEEKASNIGKIPFVVSEKTTRDLLDPSPRLPVIKPSPSNPAYAIFTSGTTGKPKVAVIEHASLSSIYPPSRNVYGMNSSTRTLQFSSYTFDVFILETMVVLMTGGCICVPSEEERMNDLPGAITRMGVNFMLAATSIANSIDPKSVPTLKTLVMGGEKMKPIHIDRWTDKCVINSYGPAEATIYITASVKTDRDGNRVNDDCNEIGVGICCRTWVVDPNDYNRLLPVGAVGELVLEGPNISRGYLNNEQKTKDAFIKNPKWANHSGLQGLFDRKERMYRTGDLVHYKQDGSLSFISRKDTQIKLNGQRIELEEIEQQCARFLPVEAQVAVDIITPETRSVGKGLAAFFTVGADAGSQNLLSMSESMGAAIQHLQTSLQSALPLIMIPKMFFPLRKLPFTTSGKLDRRALRDMVQPLSKEKLRSYITFKTGSTQISDGGLDGKLRDLWEKILDLTPGSVNAEDSFFGLGGDSFTAMKLVGAAQTQGISLTVADMFKYPIFADMAKRSDTSTTNNKQALLEPFSLLPESITREQIMEEISEQCGIPKESISDAYPCSPVQEGLITLSVKQRGAYVAQPAFRLAETIDLERFKDAWQQTVNELGILRTRIVHTESANFVQAVLKEAPISWGFAETIDQLPEDGLDLPKHNGGELTGYAIVQARGSTSRYFVWSIHHALYDGWSVPLVLKQVEEKYTESPDKESTTPYNLFIDYLLKTDTSQSDEFWKSYLSNLSCSPFPQATNPVPNALRAGNRHQSRIELPRLQSGLQLTLPELIRAAWAIVISAHTGSSDVCFGETLMGRNINLPGVTEVAGPVLTTVPTRIQVENDLEISKYLEKVHQWTTDMIPHQHSGLPRIRKLNSDTAQACDFQNLLVIQTDESGPKDDLWLAEENQATEDFFTNPLVLECKLGKSGVTTIIHHDEIVLNSWLAQKLIDQFNFVLKQLVSFPSGETKKLGTLEIFSPEDKHVVSSWNSRQPFFVDRCLHEIIEEKCSLQPDAPAVCSWDGELTYREVHELASSFASYLSARGVGPEVLVPICLDKSIWAVITILAILIAGGAFVPLDPVHPTSRHEEVLAEVSASIVLCSPKYCSRYTRVAKIIIPVSQETVKAYGALSTNATKFNRASSTNIAFAIFTSGSTGRAKGIIIDHRALASSVMGFGPLVNMNETSRVFQFASLTFDAAVMEILATLMHGGCICVPSEDERLNDVAGAIRRMNVSWTFLTPSIASIIEPASVPSLKFLACGGEKMSEEVIKKWAHCLKLMNVYGPTETSVFATLNTEVASNRDPSCIGWGIPSTLTWVVDPDNHDRLAPLGAIGELALEGPALAREYLKNPVKTAESFINDPAWIKSFSSTTGLSRRIYKTGDLVRYKPDGSVECIGRKDHQVKLHGQRMELGEIEHRLHVDTRVRHAIVIMPKSGLLKERLVTILSLNSLSSGRSLISDNACELVSEEDMTNSAYAELVELQKSLETQLPIYMVPQTWAVIRKLPMLVSGKLDRKRITQWIENLEESLYDRIMQDYDKVKRTKVERKPKNDMSSVAKLLQDIYSQVLNIPTDKVDPNRSFVSLGGDSITGMSIVSRARKQGMKLALNDVLQSGSIKELALTVGIPTSVVQHEEKSGEPFRLSPIQELYFRSSSEFKGAGRFNQSITLRVTRPTEPETVRNAIKAVINQHSMFKARFFKSSEGQWQQMVTDDVESSYRYGVHSVNDPHDIIPKVAESQQCLDIFKGPVFAAELFNIAGHDQVLFLVANHLCVDMVSWRIVLQDIQDIIDAGSPSPEKSLSFQRWCELQIEDSKKEDSQVQLPVSVNPPNLAYWDMETAPNIYGHIKTEAFILGEKATSFVLEHCSKVFKTDTIEVLLSAVIHSFRQVFTDRKAPTVYNEGHGREAWDSTIDLSRTVGWFTTVCPLSVDEDSVGFINTLKRVKDARRKVPDNGRSQFAKSILSSQGMGYSIDFPVPFEIIFNYLGRLQQLERDDSLFHHYGAPFSGKDFEKAGDMGANTARFALFEISALVIKQQLHVSFTYNRNMKHQEQIVDWISQCKETLEKDILCLQDTIPEPTLSDYPLLPITYDGLKNLVKDTFPKVGIESNAQVEDIYPCSPMQEGILLSQIRDPSAYMFHVIFAVKLNNGGDIDPKRLREAWKMVVARHPILRTVFFDSNYKGGSFDQLVIKDLNDNVLELGCSDSGALEKLAAINLRDINSQRTRKLPQQLTICKTTAGRVLIKIEMNHAIIDGGSVDLLLRDLALAYNGQLASGSGPSFSDYIKYIRSQTQQQALSHWTKYLRGVNPCHLFFPSGSEVSRQQRSIMMDFDRFPELQRFCEKTSVTLANLVLSAWAIVLRTFTGSDDVCFGYPSTGRDAPVPGIQDAVGIFINMLCCRVKFTDSATISEVSKMVQEDYIQSLPHQSCSLASIQHELGRQGQALFNTTLSIQNRSASKSPKEDSLSFEMEKAYDPTEFPITVNVETGRNREGILLRYWTDAVSDSQAKDLADAIASIFSCFIDNPSTRVSDLEIGGATARKIARPMALDNDTMKKLIDLRVRETIQQMIKEGILTLPPAQNTESNVLPDKLLSSVKMRDGSEERDSMSSSMTLASENKKYASIEKKLRKLWSSALGLSADTVKHGSSFFKLGGDSITAMKMVGAAREEGLELTVADVFNNPGFEEMLDIVCAATSSASSDIEVQSQVDHIDDEKLIEKQVILPQPVQREIIPTAKPVELDDATLRLGIYPKIGVFRGGVADVLPVTDFQALSITATLFKSRWMLNYFFLDGGGSLDLKRLRDSFLRVVDAFDILRTVFVCFNGQFFQVVLRKMRPHIVIDETDKSLDEYTEALQQRDREQDPRQGEQYAHFYVVKQKNTTRHRILIRLSHAQFDGVCLSKIMSAIKMGYEGRPLPPVSSFANYMRLLPGSITPDHYQYWTSLLEGCNMTEIIRREQHNNFSHIGSFIEVKKSIEIPSASLGNITIATIMQAAWAMTLAKLSAQSDVVFGLTISGRNATVPGVEAAIGPCVNVVPVRVKFGERWTGLDLFRYVQDQRVASMPFESLGFREIFRQCTDWSDSTYFTSSVFHQNVDYQGQMQLDDYNYRMGGAGVIDNFADLTLVSKSSDEMNLDVSLGYSSESAITASFAAKVLDMVCETAQSMVANPNSVLPSPSTLRSLPSQAVDDIPRMSEKLFLSSQLKDRSMAELLVRSETLGKAWQQVLTNRGSDNPRDTFQFDTSFFDLGGDVYDMAQVVWILEQEGLRVRLEDLLEHSTFLGQLAVLALFNDDAKPASRNKSIPVMGRSRPASVKTDSRVSLTKAKNVGAVGKAFNLAKRITRWSSVANRA